MAIIDSELILYQSETVNDTTSNGGLLSASSITTNIDNNVWPNVFKAERISGSVKYRKIFGKVDNDNDEQLYNGQFWLDNTTNGDDWVTFFEGTPTDTQNDINGSERHYGCGTLASDVSSGNTITVTLEDSSLMVAGANPIFVSGDTIRVTDKDDPDAAGNEEYLIIDTVVDSTGTDVIITTTTNLINSYTVVGGTRIMSILNIGDIVSSSSGWTETSASGTYDETTYPVITDNIGSIDQTWTLRFLDATNVEVSGNTLGIVETTLPIGSDIILMNLDHNKPYFTIDASGWGGTWALNETIEFSTVSASAAIWEKRTVPAGAQSQANNSITLVFTGETVQ